MIEKNHSTKGKKGEGRMRRQVEEFIRKHELLHQGDKVLAAVSGGADSVCLLYLLVQLREEWGIDLRAVHIHHGLREQEADRDEEFTKELCRTYEVNCTCLRADVKGFVREEGISAEEAGRILRYQLLEDEAKKWEKEDTVPVKIAVGHHGDDNVETILFHLFRGSGLKGLGGIRPLRGRIIRPLLTVTRKEILSFLEEEGISYCEDSTNRSEEYTRNKLRHKIMPLIEAEINERAPEHILQAAERMHQADEYLEKKARQWLREYGAEEEEKGRRTGADAKQLFREAAIIQTYVIRQMIEQLTGSRKDLTSVHVEDVRQLLEKQAGKQVDLPYGLTARRTYDYLWIEKNENPPVLSLPQLEFTQFFYEKGMEIPQNQYTKWFDYDRIKGVLSVRTRQTGDYFLLPGGGRKTIKSYMIDEKIPSDIRNQIPLLADGSHILWIIGKRISEGCKVTPQTKRILQVQVSKGEDNGR